MKIRCMPKRASASTPQLKMSIRPHGKLIFTKFLVHRPHAQVSCVERVTEGGQYSLVNTGGGGGGGGGYDVPHCDTGSSYQKVVSRKDVLFNILTELYRS